MNWRDVPNLFANGNFRVRIKWKNGDTEIVPLYVNSEGRAIAELNKNSGIENRAYPYQFVGLIARKIEDMTDEERQKLTVPDSFKNRLKYYWVSLSNPMTKVDFLYLLSRGVYPFEWDETVIDSNAL